MHNNLTEIKKSAGLYTGKPGWKVIKMTPEYIEEILELSSSHDTHMGLPKTGDSFGRTYWENFLDTTNPESFLIGCYNTATGELEGLMGIHLWSGFPYWTILGFTLKPGKYMYNYKKNPVMTTLWNVAITRMEMLGKIKFYMLKNNKWLKPKLIQQWEEYIGKGRYTLTIETFIPANTQTNYTGFNKLMYQKTFDADLHVMSGTLNLKESWKVTSK